jgi:hypothetical protein
MTQAFNPTPVLDHVGGVLSLIVMAGLTLTSAATWAHRPGVPVTQVVQLPPVVVTVKRAAPIAQLPTVIVVAKRSTTSTSA